MADENELQQTQTQTANEPNIKVTTSTAVDPVLVIAPATPEPEAGADADKIKKLEPWIEERIRREAFEKREANRLRQKAEDEAATLRAQLAAQRPAGDATSANGITLDEFNRRVDEQAFIRAEVIAKQQREQAEQQDFNRRCNEIAAAGQAAFSDFNEALGNLQAIGALNETSLRFVIDAADDPAAVLRELGANPSRAAEIFAMSPVKMAAAIGKMTTPAKRAIPAAAGVSKAPAPVKPIGGAPQISGEPSDDDDEETYFAKRMAQKRKMQA